MKRQPVVFFLAWLGVTLRLGGVTIFQDGFEATPLNAAWTLSPGVTGRALVTTNYGPFQGASHLVLDDVTTDLDFSVAEAKLTVNLSNYRNVVLSFRAKSIGNEPHPPPLSNFTGDPAFDGVSISCDGGRIWRAVQSLATTGPEWELFTVPLDAVIQALGGNFSPGLAIRFSAYDNAPAPLDGIAIDDVMVTADTDRALMFELPSPVREGSNTYTGYLLFASPTTTPLTVSLRSEPPGLLRLPLAVNVPAGATSTAFEFGVVDDSLVNLTRQASVIASGPGVPAAVSAISIWDDETPKLSLKLPSLLPENSTRMVDAILSLDRPSPLPFTVTLTATPAGKVVVPFVVTVASNQTQVVFGIRALNDEYLEGPVAVTITAIAPGGQPTSGQLQVEDDEKPQLSFSVPPIVTESGTVEATVFVGGILKTSLAVTLDNSRPEVISMPGQVVVPAGQYQARFQLHALDNNDQTGTIHARITATAPGFVPANTEVSIQDNEVASFHIESVPELLQIGAPTSVSVSALDVEGNVINSGSHSVRLALLRPDGTYAPVEPDTITITNGRWNGSITVSNVTATPLRLSARDVAGHHAESTPFDLLRLVDLRADDLVWDSTRRRFYACIPAGSPNSPGSRENQVVAIDPDSGNITKTTTVPLDPRRLALTSGNEVLYVARDRDGSIARLDPDTLEISSTFSLTAGQPFSLYATDMATIAGQPNLLLVALTRRDIVTLQAGVALYNNGFQMLDNSSFARELSVLDSSGTIGCNPVSGDLHRILVGQFDLFVGPAQGKNPRYAGDLFTDGDFLFGASGGMFDGASLKLLRSTESPVLSLCPDLALKRVYTVDWFQTLSVRDPATLSSVRRAPIPGLSASVVSLIRWGSNGLAFRSALQVGIIHSGLWVPSLPSADLAVEITPGSDLAVGGQPLTWTVRAVNLGTNAASNAVLSVLLSSGQVLSNIAPRELSVAVETNLVTCWLGSLPPGGAVQLTLTAIPQITETLICSASINSSSVDPDFANNRAAKMVGGAFRSTPDSNNKVQLGASDVVYDASREILWASTLPTAPVAPHSIVSLDPFSGKISDPIPLGATPKFLAISTNGHYLYVGLSDVPEIQRVDLRTRMPDLRIPLGSEVAQDIVVLPGDGTSILVAGVYGDGVVVFDGAVPRPRLHYGCVRIEPAPWPDVFVGVDVRDSGFHQLAVTSEGVEPTGFERAAASFPNLEIRGGGDFLLTSGGLLLHGPSLATRENWRIFGLPAVDAGGTRAYLLNDFVIRAFDTGTYARTGELAVSGPGPVNFIRWGRDGFAIVGNDGSVQVIRWARGVPTTEDTDADGLRDDWELANFGSLAQGRYDDPDNDGINNLLEYLLGTPPKAKTPAPQIIYVREDHQSADVKLRFQRRQGGEGLTFAIFSSDDLANWRLLEVLEEKVISVQTAIGPPLETVEVTVPASDSKMAFFKVYWQAQ